MANTTTAGAFDGEGRGRGWPLLTGERGHYAVAAGEDALPYIEAMMAMSSPLGLIPEQVWDSAPIAQYDLKPGKPSGSAMPLVWAHAEFIKLCYSRKLGARRSAARRHGSAIAAAAAARLHDLGTQHASRRHFAPAMG